MFCVSSLIGGSHKEHTLEQDSGGHDIDQNTLQAGLAKEKGRCYLFYEPSETPFL